MPTSVCVCRSRMRLYRFLLEQMTDNHRFQMQGKLVQEVSTFLAFLALTTHAPSSLLMHLPHFSCPFPALSSKYWHLLPPC